MISLLKNNPAHLHKAEHLEEQALQHDEAHLVNLIYRFAGKKDEWFNLLLSLSNCISINETLPKHHPYYGVSERLLVHLKNAIKISGQLNTGARTLLNQQAMDLLPLPAGILDASGRIVEINQLALTALENLDDWYIDAQHLKSSKLNLETQLRALIEVNTDFLALPLQGDAPESLDVSSQALDGQHIYLTQLPCDFSESSYIYFCFNQRRQGMLETAALKQTFGLTETEALVVKALVEEGSSAKVSKKLKLKDATIRGHLTSIYTKLGVNRKSELIRKVMLKSLTRATQNRYFFDAEKPALNLHHDPAKRLFHQAKTKQLSLADGRQLSYLDISNAAGCNDCDTILILHNMMGSAYELPDSICDLFAEHKLRLLIPERPGYGDSSAHPERTHESFCRDMDAFLNLLGVERVHVIAHSMGGAYALAMAEFIPERIIRIAMVNAVARMRDMLETKPVPPLIKAVHQSLRYAPFLIEPILRMAVGKDLEHFYTQRLNYLKPTKEGRAADINLLNQADYRIYSLRNLKQSSKQGIEIWAEEMRIGFTDWAFEVTNQEVEYQFWHGDEDDVIAIDSVIKLAKHVNTQRFFRLQYETHFLFSRHINDVIKELIEPGTQKTPERFAEINLN